MKSGPFAFFFALSTLPLIAQPPGAVASVSHTSSLGFSYSLPGDWEVVETPAPSILSGMKDQTQPNAANADERKGVGCVQVAFTGRHGDPASIVIARTIFAVFEVASARLQPKKIYRDSPRAPPHSSSNSSPSPTRRRPPTPSAATACGRSAQEASSRDIPKRPTPSRSPALCSKAARSAGWQ